MACEEFPSGENEYFRSTISKRGPYGVWQGWVIWQLSMKAGSEARAGLPNAPQCLGHLCAEQMTETGEATWLHK